MGLIGPMRLGDGPVRSWSLLRRVRDLAALLTKTNRFVREEAIISLRPRSVGSRDQFVNVLTDENQLIPIFSATHLDSNAPWATR